MKPTPSATRLSWKPLFMVAGFAALAFSMVSVDWSAVQAQEKGADKTADAKARRQEQLNKAIEERQKKRAEKQPAAPAVLRVTPGAGKKLDHVALAKVIDDEVNRRLKAEGIEASGKSGDAEFLRRLSLDLVGVIPSSEQVVAFLDSKDPAKRSKMIDQLLADSRFGQYHGEVWSNLMLPRESNNRKLDAKPMIVWLADNFNKNVPLNKTVFDLLTSTGTIDDNAAVSYFVGNPSVDKVTDNVTRMFLGVQLQCAQCHNHPFTDWKQAEYWGMAQFFIKTRLTANPQQAAKKGTSAGIMETSAPNNKKGAIPESAMKVPAKFLGGEQPGLAADEPYRPVLAQWLCSPQNPYFAKAMTNRFWHSMFGRGLVNPVDDMHENNLPSHPELLNALTEQFKANDFDVKYLIRAICNSETYQRTSQPTAKNREDRELYSHRAVRTMLPEQLFESLVTVTGRDQIARKTNDTAPMTKKGGGGGPRDQFLNFFRVVEEPDVLEYQAGIPQVLRMMNSGVTNGGLGAIVTQTVKSTGNEPAKVIEQLYLSGLSRRPTADETERLVAFVRRHPQNANMAYADVLWSVLNSSEFILNH